MRRKNHNKHVNDLASEYRNNIQKTSNLIEDFHSIPNIKDRPLKILIVDDDYNISCLLVQLLRMEGCEVHAVEDGASALKLAKKDKFDVVFTDLSMREISGFEVARAIRQLDRRVIIFIITGWTIETLNDDVKESCVDKAIKKPFQLDTITEALEWAKVELHQRDKIAPQN